MSQTTIHDPLGFVPIQNRKKKLWNVVFIVLGIIAGLGIILHFVLGKQNLFVQKPTEKYREIEKSPQPTPDFSKWQFYQNTAYGISMRIPQEWLIDEKRNGSNKLLGEISFFPSEKGKAYGSVNEITIKILPGTSEGTTLTSASEFKEWYDAKADIEKYGLVKVDNEVVDSQNAVIYLDSPNAPTNGYNLTSWFRKENTNYYISVEGSKEIDIEDIFAFKYLLKTITLSNSLE